MYLFYHVTLPDTTVADYDIRTKVCTSNVWPHTRRRAAEMSSEISRNMRPHV